MPLQYDFDMVSVTPEGLPDQFGDLVATGVVAEKMAMFRDRRAVAALGRADPAVRTFFQDSGFAMEVYDSGAPPGLYPASDEPSRVKVIDRLTTNLAAHDLSGAQWGEFDFQAFLAALERAKPLEDERLLVPTAQNRPPAPPPSPASRSPKRKGLAIIGLSVGVILLLYTALELIS